jgi:hypothetical protein
VKKAGLIAGGVIVVVGAVFAVGVPVGHWFGVGLEAATTTTTTLGWSRVTLPVAEAEARVGPLEELPGRVAARGALEAARAALASAQADFAEAAAASAPEVELARLQGLVLRRQAAVTGAAERFGLTDHEREYAVAAMIGTVVGEVLQAEGEASETSIRRALADPEWVFCDLKADLLAASAVSLGLLPEDPSDDLVTYWWVTRPDEYIRACRAAFALR